MLEWTITRFFRRFMQMISTWEVSGKISKGCISSIYRRNPPFLNSLSPGFPCHGSSRESFLGCISMIFSKVCLSMPGLGGSMIKVSDFLIYWAGSSYSTTDFYPLLIMSNVLPLIPITLASMISNPRYTNNTPVHMPTQKSPTISVKWPKTSLVMRRIRTKLPE